MNRGLLYFSNIDAFQSGLDQVVTMCFTKPESLCTPVDKQNPDGGSHYIH